MGTEGQKKEVELDIKQLAKDLPSFTAGTFIVAKYYRVRYDALIQVGFNGRQALEIIKARGINV